MEAYQELAGLIEEVQGLPAMNQPYDLQPETVVYIGMEKYEILTMTDSMVVLHDLTYPLFTKDMPREEFDRKLRENPANDHLKTKRPLSEPPAEKENTEPLPAGDRQGTASPKTKKEEIPEESLTLVQRNYRAVMELAPEVLRGETESKSFEAGQSFMPLTVESIGENRIAISHYYTQNGDSLADPDMEFVFDHEAKTLNARTFQQDNLNRFEQVVTDGVVDGELESELNDFASQWFKNIREQGYLPTREEKQLSESDIPIGTEVVIDDRRFSVDSVDMEHGTTSLKDLTFQSGTGFPPHAGPGHSHRHHISHCLRSAPRGVFCFHKFFGSDPRRSPGNGRCPHH